MKISKKSKELVKELVTFSGDKLKNTESLELLIEISESSNSQKQFEDIQFTAKYLNGLGKILQKNITASSDTAGNGKSISSEDARAKVIEEFKLNMKKLTDMLSFFISGLDEPQKTEFTESFLSLNQTSLQNLTTLIYDLSWLKVFKNTQRD